MFSKVGHRDFIQNHQVKYSFIEEDEIAKIFFPARRFEWGEEKPPARPFVLKHIWLFLFSEIRTKVEFS
jgi:hypothetical protein